MPVLPLITLLPTDGSEATAEPDRARFMRITSPLHPPTPQQPRQLRVPCPPTTTPPAAALPLFRRLSPTGLREVCIPPSSHGELAMPPTIELQNAAVGHSIGGREGHPPRSPQRILQWISDDAQRGTVESFPDAHQGSSASVPLTRLSPAAASSPPAAARLDGSGRDRFMPRSLHSCELEAPKRHRRFLDFLPGPRPAQSGHGSANSSGSRGVPARSAGASRTSSSPRYNPYAWPLSVPAPTRNDVLLDEVVMIPSARLHHGRVHATLSGPHEQLLTDGLRPVAEEGPVETVIIMLPLPALLLTTSTGTLQMVARASASGERWDRRAADTILNRATIAYRGARDTPSSLTEHALLHEPWRPRMLNDHETPVVTSSVNPKGPPLAAHHCPGAALRPLPVLMTTSDGVFLHPTRRYHVQPFMMTDVSQTLKQENLPAVDVLAPCRDRDNMQLHMLPQRCSTPPQQLQERAQGADEEGKMPPRNDAFLSLESAAVTIERGVSEESGVRDGYGASTGASLNLPALAVGTISSPRTHGLHSPPASTASQQQVRSLHPSPPPFFFPSPHGEMEQDVTGASGQAGSDLIKGARQQVLPLTCQERGSLSPSGRAIAGPASRKTSAEQERNFTIGPVMPYDVCTGTPRLPLEEGSSGNVRVDALAGLPPLMASSGRVRPLLPAGEQSQETVKTHVLPGAPTATPFSAPSMALSGRALCGVDDHASVFDGPPRRAASSQGLRLPVAKEGIVLFNHVQGISPPCEVYRLLRLRHRDPVRRFPEAYWGPPLSVWIPGDAAEELFEDSEEGQQQRLNATSEAEDGDHRRRIGRSEDVVRASTPRGDPVELRGNRSATAAEAAPSDRAVEVNAGSLRELYQRLLQNPMDCVVPLWGPATSCLRSPGPLSHEPNNDGDNILGAPASCPRRLVGEGRGMAGGVARVGHRAHESRRGCTATLVANGFYNAERQEEHVCREAIEYYEALDIYGEAFYYPREHLCRSASVSTKEQSSTLSLAGGMGTDEVVSPHPFAETAETRFHKMERVSLKRLSSSRLPSKASRVAEARGEPKLQRRLATLSSADTPGWRTVREEKVEEGSLPPSRVLTSENSIPSLPLSARRAYPPKDGRQTPWKRQDDEAECTAPDLRSRETPTDAPNRCPTSASMGSSRTTITSRSSGRVTPPASSDPECVLMPCVRVADTPLAW